MNKKEFCRVLLTRNAPFRRLGAIGGVSHNTARRYFERLKEEEITLEKLKTMDEAQVERLLNNGWALRKKRFVEPSFPTVHEELPQPGVTLRLLHDEYCEAAGASAMSETEFRRRYKAYKRSLRLSMREPRRPGYQLFIDYSGKRPSITCPKTGEKTPVELYVATLGASRLTFATATYSQKVRDFCHATVAAIEYIEGVPATLVPDNLKSAVVRPARKGSSPIINQAFADLAYHYETVVEPARVRKPKDKAPVENAVLVVQRWILARIRKRVFHSLSELNAEIAGLLEDMNNREMRHIGKSRRKLFEERDRPALNPLPLTRYEYGETKRGLKVPSDYHIAWERHYYSVPYYLVGQRVDVRATATSIEVRRAEENSLVAMHPRAHDRPGQLTTDPNHRPPAHQGWADAQPEALLAWAKRTDSNVYEYAMRHRERNLKRPHTWRQAIQGLRKLIEMYGLTRVANACKRGVQMDSISNSSIESMLRRNIENRPVANERSVENPHSEHENLRGAHLYH